MFEVRSHTGGEDMGGITPVPPKEAAPKRAPLTLEQRKIALLRHAAQIALIAIDDVCNSRGFTIDARVAQAELAQAIAFSEDEL